MFGSSSIWCFLICINDNDVLFQWLAALVSPYGDVLWHKFEAIQLGYESLGYIGKRQIIQRWEEIFEYHDVINFLAETRGTSKWNVFVYFL